MNKLKELYYKIPFQAILIFYTIVQFGGILIISYFMDMLLETIIFIPLFFIFRRKYSKTFHAEDFLPCTAYTFIMFIIKNKISLPISSSILLTVVLAYTTTDALYYIKDYIDIVNVKVIKIRRGMDKDLLISKCKQANLTEDETYVLVEYYCNRKKRFEIGMDLGYSEANISKIKEKALSKLA